VCKKHGHCHIHFSPSIFWRRNTCLRYNYDNTFFSWRDINIVNWTLYFSIRRRILCRIVFIYVKDCVEFYILKTGFNCFISDLHQQWIHSSPCVRNVPHAGDNVSNLRSGSSRVHQNVQGVLRFNSVSAPGFCLVCNFLGAGSGALL